MKFNKFLFGIGTIILLATIGFGMYKYIFSEEKETNQPVDLYEFIPATSSYFLTIREPGKLLEKHSLLNKFAALLPDKKTLVISETIGKYCICNDDIGHIQSPLMVSVHPEGTLYLFEMKKKESETMYKKFLSPALSGFPAKRETYKGIDIYIKSAEDEHFFCYTWYNQAFIGSYEKRLLCNAIDAFQHKNGLRNKPDFDLKIQSFDKNAFAGLFINRISNNSFLKEILPGNLTDNITGNISFKNEILNLEGFIPLKNFSDSLNIIFDPEIIPQTALSFRQTHIDNLEDCLLNNISPIDTSMYHYIRQNIGCCQFARKDSLSPVGEIIFAQTNLPVKRSLSPKDKLIQRYNNNYIMLFNGYFLISKEKENIEAYVSQIECGLSIKDRQSFQPLFLELKDTALRSISWKQKSNRHPYNQLSILRQNKEGYEYRFLLFP